MYIKCIILLHLNILKKIFLRCQYFKKMYMINYRSFKMSLSLYYSVRIRFSIKVLNGEIRHPNLHPLPQWAKKWKFSANKNVYRRTQTPLPSGLKSTVKKNFSFYSSGSFRSKKQKTLEFSLSVASLNCTLSPGFKSTVREPHPPPKEE